MDKEKTHVSTKSEVAQSSDMPEIPKKFRKSYIILMVIVTLLILSSVSYLLLSMKSMQTPVSLQSASIANPSTVPTKSLVKEYKTRHFDVTKNFWQDIPYPTEIVSMQESDLTPTYCTPLYSHFGEDEYTSYDEAAQQPFPLTDTTVMQYIQTLEKKYDEDVRQIIACSTDDGRTILSYSMGPSGGGYIGTPYLGVLEGSEVEEIAESPELKQEVAYYSCNSPMQLTENGIFYLICGGGDGGFGSRTIYKLSLKTKTISKIIHCESGRDQSEITKFSCK